MWGCSGRAVWQRGSFQALQGGPGIPIGRGQGRILVLGPYPARLGPSLGFHSVEPRPEAFIPYFLTSKWLQALKKMSALIRASVSLSVKWRLAGLPAD